MRELATSIVLLALSVPALALGQLTEISPLLAKPSLSFDAEPETGWVAESWKPELFVIGLTGKAEGALEPEVPVVAQRGASGWVTGGVIRKISAEDYRGQRIRLSARLKSQDAVRLQLVLKATISTFASLTYDMSDRPIRGTTDWRFYEIVMDVPLYAQHLSYGFRLAGGTRLFGPRDGRGIAWGDSFQIAVVGKDVPVSAEYLAADYTPPVRLTQNARMRAVADMKERAIFDAWVNRGNTGRDPRSTP